MAALVLCKLGAEREKRRAFLPFRVRLRAVKGHFSVSGVPVRVRPVFFLMIGVLAFPRGPLTGEAALRVAIWIAVVFVSILWHELGHAWMMRRFGYAPSIELHAMGGHTEWGESGAVPSPKARILVSLAGPLAGFLLGGIVWLVAPFLRARHDLLDEAVRGLLWANIGWGFVNLVPMLPWDGGHAMHGLIDLKVKERGARIAGALTLVTAGACAIGLALHPLGKSLWLWFLLAISVERGVRAIRGGMDRTWKLAPQATGEAIYAAVRKALGASDPQNLIQRALSAGEADEAWVGHGRVLRAYADEATERAEVLELSAWCFLLGADPKAAGEAVRAMWPAHEPSVPLAATLAICEDRVDEVLTLDDEFLPDDLRVYALWATGQREQAWFRISERTLGQRVDAALFYRGRYEDSAALALALFEAFEDPSDAYNAACAYARLEDAEEGLRWLGRAVDAGLKDPALLDDDQDLAFLRDTEGFRAIRNAAGE